MMSRSSTASFKPQTPQYQFYLQLRQTAMVGRIVFAMGCALYFGAIALGASHSASVWTLLIMLVVGTAAGMLGLGLCVSAGSEFRELKESGWNPPLKLDQAELDQAISKMLAEAEFFAGQSPSHPSN